MPFIAKKARISKVVAAPFLRHARLEAVVKLTLRHKEIIVPSDSKMTYGVENS